MRQSWRIFDYHWGMTEKKNNPAHQLGRWGESLAQTWLEKQGFETLARNYTTEYGEIDLVMRKTGCLHFVEVKTRRTRQFGNPEDAVAGAKITHMVEAAQRYIQLHPELDGDWQIDVVAIFAGGEGEPEIRWFENAV